MPKYKVTCVIVAEVEAPEPNVAAAVAQTGIATTMAFNNIVTGRDTYVEKAAGLVKVV